MTGRWGSIIAAFLAAAVAGSFALSVEAAVFVAFTALNVGGPDAAAAVGLALFSAVTGVLFVAPVFLIGLVTVGGPAWLIVSKTQIRSRTAATIVGALLAGAVAAIVLVMLGLIAGAAPAVGAAALVLPGAVAGWVLHRVAYGLNPNP